MRDIVVHNRILFQKIRIDKVISQKQPYSDGFKKVHEIKVKFFMDTC